MCFEAIPCSRLHPLPASQRQVGSSDSYFVDSAGFEKKVAVAADCPYHTLENGPCGI